MSLRDTRLNRSLWPRLFLTFFLISVFFFDPSRFGNAERTVLLTKALVERGEIEIDHYMETSTLAWLFGGVVFFGDHWYSTGNPGASLLGVAAYWPFYRIWQSVGIVANALTDYYLSSFVIGVLVAAMTGAGLCTLLGWSVFRMTGDRRAALYSGLILYFATPVFYYSTVVNHNILETVLLFWAFLWSLLGRRGMVRDVGLGLLLGFAVTNNWGALPPALAIGIWHGIRHLRSRFEPAAIVRLGVGVIAGVAPLLIYQQVAFGDPWLPAHVHYMDRMYESPLTNLGGRMLGQLADPRYGLLAISPLFILAPIALLGRSEAGGPRALRSVWTLTLVLTAIYVGFYGFVGNIGQPGYGYRYLLPLAPFWVLTLLLTFKDRTGRWMTALFGLLLLVSCLVNVAAGVTRTDSTGAVTTVASFLLKGIDSALHRSLVEVVHEVGGFAPFAQFNPFAWLGLLGVLVWLLWRGAPFRREEP